MKAKKNQDKKNLIELTAEAMLDTDDYGEFKIYIFRNLSTEKEHIALVKGSLNNQSNVLCRIASECLPGTVFHYNGCECREQIDASLKMINKSKSGIFIYLRQEGRGQGLTAKIRALSNKNKGMDTFSAVEALGLQPDIREYWEAAEIIKHFNINSIQLLTNCLDKVKELEALGIAIEKKLPLEIAPTEHTKIHLQAKKRRGYDISLV